MIIILTAAIEVIAFKANSARVVLSLGGDNIWIVRIKLIMKSGITKSFNVIKKHQKQLSVKLGLKPVEIIMNIVHKMQTPGIIDT